MKSETKVYLLNRENLNISDELNYNTLYLDGIVKGITNDREINSWSFDHHGDLPRFSTMSTTKQIVRAAALGFNFESIREIYINHIDVDSISSAYAALSYDTPLQGAVVEIIDSVDVNGPVLTDKPSLNLFRAYARELDLRFEEDLHLLKEEGEGVDHPLNVTEKVLKFGDECLRNYKFFTSNYKVEDGESNYGKIEFLDTIDVGGVKFISAQSDPTYYGGMKDCYDRGAHVAMCFSKIEGSDNHIVTIAKKSDFVWLPFNNLMAKLNELENEINPGNSGWGGGTTIGGYPRPMGTKIPIPQIIEVIKSLL